MSNTGEKNTSHEQLDYKKAIALQTYEYFEGGPDQKTAIANFIDKKSKNLDLKYPSLESGVIDRFVSVLHQEVATTPDAIATSEYRLAEAYFLQAARRINRKERVHSQEVIDNFQLLNEAIYGKPDEVVVNQMLTQIWDRLDTVKSPAAATILEQLKSGYALSFGDGESVPIPVLPRPEVSSDNRESLPILEDETIEWLKDSVSKRYGVAQEIFNKYFNENETPEGVDACHIAELFESAIAEMGLDVAVIQREDVSALSWSSADQAVIVGLDRKPIKTPEELFGLFVHEVGVHGVRSTLGSSTGVDALGVGLFTEADSGEDPSYLTFEEGLASTLQLASQGKKESWNVAGMGLYLTVAFAHMGWSPRQIQEVMSNVRIALGASEADVVISEEKVNKAQAAAATHVRRIFRGTPAGEELKTSDGVTLHYAKDLAYAAGKVKAIEYLNNLSKLNESERERMFDILLSAKYDPTNTVQAKIVESVQANGRVEE
ncbi:hypothetical protein KC974_00445 [Candidatus Saccharibacteria bacterium]|jgi:hypothetical protein|nr:hypothetical protein [Candidatus Saccharibacteria bacterium]